MSVSVRNRSVNTEASDDEMVVTDTTADAAETGFTWTTRIRRKLKHSITIILQNHEKKWSHENICCNSTATATLVFQVEENGNINPVSTVNLGIDQLIFRKLSE